MKHTKRLTSQLELQYGNNHVGLAQQVGYLTGVLKALETEYKSAGTFIDKHTDHLVQTEKARALALGGVATQCFMASAKRNR